MVDISILIDEFLDDANGHIGAVEVALMDLEKRWSDGVHDQALLTLLLGNLHTLKGNSGMMGFTPVQQYVHRLESALKLVQDGTSPLTSTMFEILFSAVSALRSNLARLSDDPRTVLDFSDELQALDCNFFAGSNPQAGEAVEQEVGPKFR